MKNCQLAIGTFLLIAISPVWADGASLRGVVYAGRIHGPTVAGVKISAPGANTQVTLSDGAFELIFSNRSPGELVQIDVAKRGYKVTNLNSQYTLPVDPIAGLVNLVLVKDDEGLNHAEAEIRSSLIRIIDKTFLDKLDVIRQEQKDMKAQMSEIAELCKNRDMAVEIVESNSSHLIDLQYSSEIFEKVSSLLSGGRAEEALTLLNSHNDQEKARVAQELRKLADAEVALASIAQGFLLEAQILSTSFRFDAAKERYQYAVAIGPDNFNAQFEFAEFSAALNRFGEAKELYQEAIAIAKRSGDSANEAKARSGLGLAHFRLSEWRAARKNYNKSIQLYKLMLWRDHDSDSEGLANSYNRKGRLLLRYGKFDEARQAHEDALRIARRLTDDNRALYLPLLSRTLGSLANISNEQLRLEEARVLYEEALSVSRELAQRDPLTYSHYIAFTLNNMGLLYYKQNRLSEARLAFEEALETYRSLADQNPEGYRPFVAKVLNNLGFVLSDLDMLDEARRDHDMALNIFLDLLDSGRAKTYQRELGEAYNNLGNICRLQRQFEQASAAHEESLEIRRHLASQDNSMRLDLAETLNDIGILLSEQNRPEEAFRAYSEALEIRSNFARQHGEIYLPLVAETKNNLGVLHRELNRSGNARKAFEEALDIRRVLAKEQRDAFLPLVAETLYNLGTLLRELGRDKKAYLYLDEALTIYEQLIKEGYEQFSDELEMVRQEMQELSRRR